MNALLDSMYVLRIFNIGDLMRTYETLWDLMGPCGAHMGPIWAPYRPHMGPIWDPYRDPYGEPYGDPYGDPYEYSNMLLICCYVTSMLVCY